MFTSRRFCAAVLCALSAWHAASGSRLVRRKVSADYDAGGKTIVAAQEVSHPKALEAAHVEGGGTSLIAAHEAETLPIAGIAAVTEVTHESWLSRLQNAFYQLLFGIVLMVLSVPALWVNEGRNAQMETLLSRAQEDCVSVKSGEALKDNCNRLVHISGGQLLSAAQVSDPDFSVSFANDCIRLKRNVEVYQVIEHQKQEKRETLGGGQETITTYSYMEAWSGVWHESGGYHDPQKRINTKPRNLTVGSHITSCSKVKYASGFVLPKELVEQCDGFQSASERLGDSITFGDLHFNRRESGLFFHGASGAPDKGNRVGDVRVRFEYVPEGEASVMALQAEEQQAASFLPFRVISRGFLGNILGLDKEKEGRLLLEQAQKSREELVEESQVGGGSCLVAMCCCACNLVSCVMMGAFTPQIFHLYHGAKDKKVCLRKIQQEASRVTWTLRVVAWFLMFLGLNLLFEPIWIFITVVPWLGPLLATVGRGAILILSFVATLLASTLISTLAYYAYRPLWAILYGAMLAAIVALPYALGWAH